MAEAKRITVEQVAQLVSDGKTNATVVDVRGEDFAEGHIRGAVQWELERFTDDAQVDQLIQEHLLGKSQVIVHCAKSQVRGPRAAGRIAERLQQLASEKGLTPEVLVMEGGFDAFSQAYGSDATLVAKQDTQ